MPSSRCVIAPHTFSLFWSRAIPAPHTSSSFSSRSDASWSVRMLPGPVQMLPGFRNRPDIPTCFRNRPDIPTEITMWMAGSKKPWSNVEAKPKIGETSRRGRTWSDIVWVKHTTTSSSSSSLWILTTKSKAKKKKQFQKKSPTPAHPLREARSSSSHKQQQQTDSIEWTCVVARMHRRAGCFGSYCALFPHFFGCIMFVFLETIFLGENCLLLLLLFVSNVSSFHTHTHTSLCRHCHRHGFLLGWGVLFSIFFGF